MTLINLTGFQRGIAADETGINIREIKSTVEPEFIEILGDRKNEARGKAVGAMKLTVNISGEISGSDGIMAATAITDYSATNSTAYFGAPTTDLMLTKGEVTESRDGWKDLSADFEAYAGITIGGA